MAAKRKKAGKATSIKKGRKKARQTGQLKKARWKARFLEVLKEQGAVTTASKMAGVCRATVYTARSQDPQFAAEWDAAVDAMIDGVEDAVIHRARYGSMEPVVHKGEFSRDEDGEVLCIRRWSDTLQMFALRQSRPDKWARAEKLKVEHQGTVSFQIVTNVPEPDTEEPT